MNRYVVDIGAYTTKVGLVDSVSPQFIFKTLNVIAPVKPVNVLELSYRELERIISYIFKEMQLINGCEIVFIIPSFDINNDNKNQKNMLPIELMCNNVTKSTKTTKVEKICEPLLNSLALSTADLTSSSRLNKSYTTGSKNLAESSGPLSQSILTAQTNLINNINITNTCIKVKELRKNLATLAFKYGCSKVGFITDANAALYSYGKSSGIVVSVSHSAIKCTAVYESTPIYSIGTYELNSDSITKKLITLIRENGHFLNGTPDYEIIEDAKENLTYVSLNYDAEINQFETIEKARKGIYLSSLVTEPQEMNFSESLYARNITLSNGKILPLGKERFIAPEILFNNEKGISITQQIIKVLTEGVIKIFGDSLKFEKNIIITGGGSMILNFSKRLETELNGLEAMDSETSVIVNSIPTRMFSEYIGAVAAAKTSTFEKKCMISSLDELSKNIILI